MSKIYEFLKTAGVFFIATEEGEQAFRVLPFLRDSYPENGEHKLAVFYADKLEAYAYDLSGKKEKL